MKRTDFKVEDFDPDEWGNPPPDLNGLDPKRWAREGEWRRNIVWSLGPGYDAQYLVWYAEFLELDGHEECCHHTWPSFVTVRQLSWHVVDDDS